MMLIAQLILLVFPFYRLGVGVVTAAHTECGTELVATIIAKFTMLASTVTLIYLAGGYSRIGL